MVNLPKLQKDMGTGSHDALSWVYITKNNRHNKPDEKAQEVGRVLRELHSNRIDADYKHDPAEDVEEPVHVSTLIARARNAIKDLSSVNW